MTPATRPSSRYAGWLVRDKPNAAGRMGLFRIYFAGFYLWRLSNFRLTELDDVAWTYHPTGLFTWVPAPPSVGVLECALVTALSLLLAGVVTPLATFAVLVLGVWFELCRMSFTGIGLAMFPMVFWVPAIALFSDWGATYSIDNLLRRRRGAEVSPTDPSGHRFWAARSLLICVSALYFSAGLSKIFGTWLHNPHFVRDLLLSKNVGNHVAGHVPLNPLVPLIASSGFLSGSMQYGAILFETSFPLSIGSRVARGFFFRVIPMFHAMNMFLFGIPVVEVLCIYGAFVDWQALLPRGAGASLERLAARAARRSVAVTLLAIATCLGVGILWNTALSPRAVLNLGGVLRSFELWVLVTVVAVGWWTTDVVRLARRYSGRTMSGIRPETGTS